MGAPDVWDTIPQEKIERFLLELWRIVSEDGWDQPSSLRHIRIEERELTSSHPRFFQEHPGELLDGKHVSKHVDATVLFFEGWTYPEALSREEMEEQGALIRPSQHPRRVEMRQALLMARNGDTYCVFQKRGEETVNVEQVNIPGEENRKEVAGTITHAMRCYMQAPYHKDIPSPYITWLRNVVGQTLSGVIEYASEKGATQQDLTTAIQDVAMLIDLSLNPEKGKGSPAMQTIESLKERHHAPTPETNWEQVRDSLILDAYLSQQSSRVRHLKWLDDAALQETLDDTEIANKARTLMALIDDKTTKNYLEAMLALIDFE